MTVSSGPRITTMSKTKTMYKVTDWSMDDTIANAIRYSLKLLCIYPLMCVYIYKGARSSYV